jgi:hypothetical protein
MGHPLDPEFPSLLQPGFVDLDLATFEARFVTAFPTSSLRRPIFTRFVTLLNLLSDLGLSCQAWLDGSYLTEKPEPDDIDIALLVDDDILGRLTPSALDTYNSLIDNHFETKTRYKCDLYSIDQADFHARAYWRGLFGFARSELPKGIGRMQI